MTSPDPQPNSESGYRQHRFTPPPGAATLLLIRHGESARAHPDHPFPLTEGRGDPPLAPEGEAEAELLARRLRHEHFDALYVTPLRRTSQTAAPLARTLGLTPRIEPGLIEVSLGDWEGGLWRKMQADQHPIAQRVVAEGRWDVIPGAEPGDQFAARVKDALIRIATFCPDQRVAVFTHGGVIGQALALATGTGLFTFAGAANGSISELVIARPTWTVQRYNDTAHLTPTTPWP